MNPEELERAIANARDLWTALSDAEEDAILEAASSWAKLQSPDFLDHALTAIKKLHQDGMPIPSTPLGAVIAAAGSWAKLRPGDAELVERVRRAVSSAADTWARRTRNAYVLHGDQAEAVAVAVLKMLTEVPT